MTERPERILFLGKGSEELAARAGAYLKQQFLLTEIHLGGRSEAFPAVDNGGPFDYVISYLSPWVVPSAVLERARCAAINFHPGPPGYPGIGCTNFAIYDGVGEYGVTCHHMSPKVDTGAIIKVVRFPLYGHDSVLTLTQRCYAYIALLFYEIVDLMIACRPLPAADEKWQRQPYRRADLERLCRLTRDMSPEEIQRRVRATTFPGFPGALFAK